MSGPYTQPLVYFFGQGRADGTAAMKEILGGKGAGLAEMTTIGIPVPPGFTIASSICIHYLESRQFPKRLRVEVENALQRLETATGKHFGDGENPLLVSVRSGAAVSMPGMMETILNLGLNDATVEGLTRQSQNPRFAWDSYRRFVQMYGTVVFDLVKAPFEHLMEEARHTTKVERDIDLPVEAMQMLVRRFKEHIRQETGREFPDDPLRQLWGAIAAVFESWNTRRAIDYRKLHDIPDSMGTAINIVAMVFGNLGEDSGTGVTFSRDPSTGERMLYGEFLLNAQGEDVVSGSRTPLPISALKDRLPHTHQELERVARTLERHFRDVQDMEFTVERGVLYMLQTRRGQRSGQAAVRIACEMVDEGLISEEEAVARIPPGDLDQLLHPTIDAHSRLDLLTTGLPASPGAACGTVVFDADRAEKLGRAGQPVILVRRETSPEDFHGMVAAKAILTARGGMTSHAAVVARGMGKPCVAGAQELTVDEKAGQFAVNGRRIAEGEWITVDGGSGQVFAGQAALIAPELSGNFVRLMQWADRIRQLRVRVNADTPADAHRGRDFGAEGIGLCRTEHMFFDGERLSAMREMIVAQDHQGRERRAGEAAADAAGRLRGHLPRDGGLSGHHPAARPAAPRVPAQGAGGDRKPRHRAGDSGGSAPGCDRPAGRGEPHAGASGLPPRHHLSRDHSHAGAGDLRGRLHRGEPQRPGHARGDDPPHRERGRVPEAGAGRAAGGRGGLPRAEHHGAVPPRHDDRAAPGLRHRRRAGPRGAVLQLRHQRPDPDHLGLSRDDAGHFLPWYIEHGVIDDDPFQVLDQQGVGKLIQMAGDLGRRIRPDLKLGICGEHGGEPSAVAFCDRLGMNYVSCSPFRVPIARLAAAQAALAARGTMDRTRATV